MLVYPQGGSAVFEREESIHVAGASPGDVYAYVSDISRYHEWAFEDVFMRSLGEGRFESYPTAGMAKHRAAISIETAEEPLRFTCVAKHDLSGTEHWTIVIASDGKGSTVTFRMQLMRDSFLTGWMQPLIFWPLVGRPRLLKRLSRLQRRLEGN